MSSTRTGRRVGPLWWRWPSSPPGAGRVPVSAMSAVWAAVVVVAAVMALAAAGCGSSSTATRPAVEDAAPSPSRRPVRPEQLLPSAVVVEGIACAELVIGTGVVVDQGVLTNAHVVAGVDEILVRIDEDADAHPATLVAIDTEADLALLFVADIDLPSLPIGEPEADLNATALVGGSGFIEARPAAIERTIAITITDIYGEGEYRRAGLELSADIEAGDSGGAVVNEAGEVVGLVFSASRYNAELSYAVSSVEFDALFASVDPDGVDSGRCR